MHFMFILFRCKSICIPLHSKYPSFRASLRSSLLIDACSIVPQVFSLATSRSDIDVWNIFAGSWISVNMTNGQPETRRCFTFSVHISSISVSDNFPHLYLNNKFILWPFFCLDLSLHPIFRNFHLHCYEMVVATARKVNPLFVRQFYNQDQGWCLVSPRPDVFFSPNVFVFIRTFIIQIKVLLTLIFINSRQIFSAWLGN